MKVSVIVLIYNMEELLPKCLTSLDSQTLTDMEFVLVDDGSTDGSPKICDDWQPKNNNVKIVIHKKNGGVMAGWMDGVKASSGEYVGFLDSDDFADADMYKILYDKAKEYDLDISMCDHMYERDNGSFPCGQIIKEGLYEGQNLDKIRTAMLPRLAEKYLSPSLCNKIFKREYFMSNWQFCNTEISVADDVNVVVPCMLGAKRFYYTDKPLYHYVVRQGSTSFLYKETLYRQYKLLIDGLKRAFSYYGIEDEKRFSDAISHFGLQWLRMVINSDLPKDRKKELYKTFSRDQEFYSSAKVIKNTRNNKWTNAYYDFFKKGSPKKYKRLIAFMNLRKRLLGR